MIENIFYITILVISILGVMALAQISLTLKKFLVLPKNRFDFLHKVKTELSSALYDITFFVMDDNVVKPKRLIFALDFLIRYHAAYLNNEEQDKLHYIINSYSSKKNEGSLKKYVNSLNLVDARILIVKLIDYLNKCSQE